MNKPITVSVIMNCLNGESHLAEAFNSLQNQTFRDFEVIFFDNASTDKSPEIAKSFGSQLKYIRNNETIPLGKARNLAILAANGKYIAFLDCDDLWKPEKLAKQVEIFESKPNVGLVCTDTLIFKGKHVLKRLFKESPPARGRVYTELLKRQWISMSSAMIRREALLSLSKDKNSWAGDWFDESLNVCEEADVFYRITHDWEIDYVDSPLTLWRVHDTNNTFKKFGQFADETLKILDKHRNLYHGYDSKYPEIVALLTRRAAFQKAIALWQNGQGKHARQHIKPFRYDNKKHKLFWYISYLPSALFSILARLYFALPSWIKR